MTKGELSTGRREEEAEPVQGSWGRKQPGPWEEPKQARGAVAQRERGRGGARGQRPLGLDSFRGLSFCPGTDGVFQAGHPVKVVGTPGIVFVRFSKSKSGVSREI